MIPGGNDSYGAGLSAGGAQVIGQSQGLNDLVKLGMARQKQKQQRLWNAPLQNIDTSKIKASDVAPIMDAYKDYRDKAMQANLEPDMQAKYQLMTDSNNSYIKAMDLSRVSQDSQNKLQELRGIAKDPNFDPTGIDDYNKYLGQYEKATSGSQEENDAESHLSFQRYQKIDPAKMDQAINAEVQKSAYMDMNQNAPGAVKDMHYQEKKVASFQTMLGTLGNFSDANTATKNMFAKQGADILSNPGNTQYLQNLKGMGNIDPSNPEQVGRANYVYHKIEGLKGATVTKDSHTYPGKGLNISMGGQPDAVNSGAINNVSSPVGFGIEDSEQSLTNHPYETALDYKNNWGGNKQGSAPGGWAFNLSTGKRELMPAMSNLKIIGNADVAHYKPGTPLALLDGKGKATGSTDAGQAPLSRNMRQMLKDQPNGELAKHTYTADETHVIATVPDPTNPGHTKEVHLLYPTHQMNEVKDFAPGKKNSPEAAANANSREAVRSARKDNNDANPANDAKVERRSGGAILKTLPGYNKSK